MRDAGLWLRRSEWVTAVYLLYIACVSGLLPSSAAVRGTLIGANLLFLAGLFWIAGAAAPRQPLVLRIARDFFTLGMLIYGYRAVGWLAPSAHTISLERGWIIWDRVLLDDWGLRSGIERFGGLLPHLFEGAYTLVYAIAPFSVLVLYLTRNARRTDRLLTPIALATFGTYALYPFFPSELPWTVFPGQDLPTVSTWFRSLNAGMVGGFGIHTSVFPSAHVSTAIATGLALLDTLPERPWIGALVLVLASFIGVATIYGRYHYAVDAVAGAMVAITAFAVSRWWLNRVKRRLS